jgi:hypothetical protein
MHGDLGTKLVCPRIPSPFPWTSSPFAPPRCPALPCSLPYDAIFSTAYLHVFHPSANPFCGPLPMSSAACSEAHLHVTTLCPFLTSFRTVALTQEPTKKRPNTPNAPSPYPPSHPIKPSSYVPVSARRATSTATLSDSSNRTQRPSLSPTKMARSKLNRRSTRPNTRPPPARC